MALGISPARFTLKVPLRSSFVVFQLIFPDEKLLLTVNPDEVKIDFGNINFRKVKDSKSLVW